MKIQGSLAILWKKCNFAVTKHKKKSYECNFDEQFVELLENSTKESAAVGMQRKKLVFPKIEKEFKVSQEVLDMVCGTLPEDFDFDKEKEIMWEEMAQ